MGNKTVTLWQPQETERASAPLPLIYLNVFEGNGEGIWQACRELECPPFTLAAIGGLDWNRELSPWPCEGTVRDAEPFAGEAEAYLDELLGSIVPEVEGRLAAPPAWRGIAGYSLAGLFALWATTHTHMFSCAASVSGSLWFPDFTDYLQEHAPSRELAAVYLSLGKKEHKTPNRMMRNVLESTHTVEEILQQRKIDTVFELNPGNHFAEPNLRCARGIRLLLEPGRGLPAQNVRPSMPHIPHRHG